MKIAINGVSGRMGTAIFRIAKGRGHSLAAGFDIDKSPLFGKDASEVIHCEPTGVKIGTISADALSGADVMLDFSSPGALKGVLDAAVKAGKPVVIGTTGLGEEGKKAIEEAAKSVAVLYSTNMAVGVNLLFKLTEMAAGALQEGWDFEVFEAHHKLKKDSPSGTAKTLVEMIKKSVKKLSSAKEEYRPEGIIGERKNDEIGVQVLRGGDIVGEHTVFIVGMGERIELTHRSMTRDVLAAGAVRAAEFMAGKKPGLYNMFDVLGLK